MSDWLIDMLFLLHCVHFPDASAHFRAICFTHLFFVLGSLCSLSRAVHDECAHFYSFHRFHLGSGWTLLVFWAGSTEHAHPHSFGWIPSGSDSPSFPPLAFSDPAQTPTFLVSWPKFFSSLVGSPKRGDSDPDGSPFHLIPDRTRIPEGLQPFPPS